MFYARHIFICTNQKSPDKVCCANTGGAPYFIHLKEALKLRGLHGPDKIRVSQSGCLGRCNQGPCMVIYPEGVWFRYESMEDIDLIIQSYLIENKPVPHLTLCR